jgi:hypothetical protein
MRRRRAKAGGGGAAIDDSEGLASIWSKVCLGCASGRGVGGVRLLEYADALVDARSRDAGGIGGAGVDEKNGADGEVLMGDLRGVVMEAKESKFDEKDDEGLGEEEEGAGKGAARSLRKEVRPE